MADSEYTALVREVRKKLSAVRFNLEMVYAGLISAAGALKFQNEAQDPEVAHVLEHLLGPLTIDQADELDRCVEALSPVVGEPSRRAWASREAAH